MLNVNHYRTIVFVERMFVFHSASLPDSYVPIRVREQIIPLYIIILLPSSQKTSSFCAIHYYYYILLLLHTSIISVVDDYNK